MINTLFHIIRSPFFAVHVSIKDMNIKTIFRMSTLNSPYRHTDLESEPVSKHNE